VPQASHLRAVRLGGDPDRPPLVVVSFKALGEVPRAERLLQQGSGAPLSRTKDPRGLVFPVLQALRSSRV